MIILRDKNYSWFSFGKKRSSIAKTPDYRCPSISELPINLQQSLKGVERVWKKSDVQSLLKQLGKEVVSDVTPFMPYVDPKYVEHVHREILVPSMAADGYPESTLIYPLMWDLKGYWLLCFNITENKFITVGSDDYEFVDEEQYIKTLRDYIKDNIKWQIEEEDEFLTMEKDEVLKLAQKIKKAFWIN